MLQGPKHGTSGRGSITLRKFQLNCNHLSNRSITITISITDYKYRLQLLQKKVNYNYIKLEPDIMGYTSAEFVHLYIPQQNDAIKIIKNATVESFPGAPKSSPYNFMIITQQRFVLHESWTLRDLHHLLARNRETTNRKSEKHIISLTRSCCASCETVCRGMTSRLRHQWRHRRRCCCCCCRDAEESGPCRLVSWLACAIRSSPSPSHVPFSVNIWRHALRHQQLEWHSVERIPRPRRNSYRYTNAD